MSCSKKKHHCALLLRNLAETVFSLWEGCYLLMFSYVGKAQKACGVIQTLSAQTYKLKVQKCPEIAAKNNLIVFYITFWYCENIYIIKQHF